MSTDLKSRNRGTVGLTRFWGGENRGACVQVTTGLGLAMFLFGAMLVLQKN